MKTDQESIPPRRATRVLALLLAALAAWMSYQGWGRWADVQIDFGRELYVPWRLAEGDWLYRDIAYFNGPLSPYFNALVFKLLGVGYWQLVGVNAALLLAFGTLLWKLLRGALPSASDGLAILAFLCFACALFFLGQHALCGNYNFLSPYSHEATHGSMLGLWAVFVAWNKAPGRRRSFFVGLLLGMVLLTKPELFLASLGGVGVLFLQRSRRQGFPKLAPSLLAGVLLPGLVALLALSTRMPISQAAEGILGAWPHLLGSQAAQLAFYQNILGVDDLAGNAGALLAASGLLLGLWALGGCLERSLPTGPITWVGLFALSLLGWSSAQDGPLAPAVWLARALPLGCLLILSAGWMLRARLQGSPDAQHWMLLQALSLFGLVLLAKMILRPRFEHYGFYLSLPASAALMVFGLGWLPQWIGSGRRGVRAAGGALQACLLGAYAAAALQMLGISQAYFQLQNRPMATGVDAMWTDFRGRELGLALEEIDQRLAPTDELLVLPEGIGLNYFARRKTPSRFLNFMPLEFALYGETAMLEELKSRPPQAVLMVHKDTSEYGYPFFGRDYGEAIYAWVLSNYRSTWIQSRGGAPLQPGTIFGVALYELNTP